MLGAFSFLWKDFLLLKVIFTIMCVLLLMQDFYLALVEKPTLTTSMTEPLALQDFPTITLCPENPVNYTELQRLGFHDIYDYIVGYNWETNITEYNWRGNSSLSVSEINKRISVLKSAEDCPIATLVYISKDYTVEERLINVTKSLTKVLFPYHICCKLDVPRSMTSDHVVRSIFIFRNKSESINYKFFMSEKSSFTKFKLHERHMNGDKIYRPQNRLLGFYKIKIFQKIQMENDPNYPCIDYRSHGDYDKCIEDELVKKNFQMLSCTPPWLTNKEELWCNGNVSTELIGEEKLRYQYFIRSIVFGVGDVKNCPRPCLTSKFEVTNVGSMEDTIEGIYIDFEESVEKTVSGLQITALSMISRIGGIIGLGKNLLWIIILAFSSLKFLNIDLM